MLPNPNRRSVPLSRVRSQGAFPLGCRPSDPFGSTYAGASLLPLVHTPSLHIPSEWAPCSALDLTGGCPLSPVLSRYPPRSSGSTGGAPSIASPHTTPNHGHTRREGLLLVPEAEGQNQVVYQDGFESVQPLASPPLTAITRYLQGCRQGRHALGQAILCLGVHDYRLGSDLSCPSGRLQS